MKKTYLTITISPEVVEAIDSVRGLVKRSTYIEDVLKREVMKEDSNERD